MTSIMSLLFGKKRRHRRSNKSKKVAKKPKGLTASLIKKAKKYRVKIYKKAGKKKVYRKVAAIKKAIRRKMKKAGKHTKRRRHHRFGVSGGMYPALSAISSAYPYAVDATPPWMS